MRKNIVAGNWKMNTTVAEGVQLAQDVDRLVKGKEINCGVIVCTPFTHLTSVAEALKGSKIRVGAENCARHEKGAYTGEVSAAMVKSTGAEYVILGHSERRQYFGEDNAELAEKLRLALDNGLLPIFCVGEVLEQRENGTYNEVVASQLEPVLSLSAEDFAKVVVAYEPVWAIGTGKTATADQAQDMHAHIRSLVSAKFGAQAADDTTILYGGSCKPTNARELFAKPDVDGGLIGGAALKAADFMGIIEAFD
ncbi:MAG TPA: triose-phosphate isomerase [Porphyromonadaceae bacterium]|nr:triose-phosphate isomerase [Porphyromonadaceae bacterium]